MRTASRAMGLLAVVLAAFAADSVRAQGMLIPTDRAIAPLGIVYQRVHVSIRDQAAVTRVEQEFRNHTSQTLEAYYLFPLPAGAGVKDFAMWIDGKRITAELVEAKKARQIYEEIVRRTKDPGLLEFMGNDLWRVRVFPVQPRSTQKIEITYSELVRRDANVAEYVYPLKTTTAAMTTEQDFTIRVELASSTAFKSIYSPSHDVSVSRQGEHRAIVGFEASRYPLDRNFHLFWTNSDQDVGISILTNRESPGDAGYFLLMLSPKTDLSPGQRVPRDLVFVVDTSGSMKGEKIEQAKKALRYCLKSLEPEDRFNLVHFATTTNAFESKLQKVNGETVAKAARWVDELVASGGTAIDEALQTALGMRTDESRNFTVVFLTDGLPTIGDTDPKNILNKVKQRNLEKTRIFVFGVGDDVNTHLLDQLAELTRAASVYVRPKEDLEVKVSSFYAKISHPVFADLKLVFGNPEIRIDDVYPPKLPDLFHGGQLLVLGRYKGAGHTAVTLAGMLGDRRKEFVQEVYLPVEKHDNEFLPGLWGRRKVGYLLDQIRLHGENKELIDEVIALAKKYGIATPYTSYLIVPDDRPIAGPVPQPRPGLPGPIRRFQLQPSAPAAGGGYGGQAAAREQSRMAQFFDNLSLGESELSARGAAPAEKKDSAMSAMYGSMMRGSGMMMGMAEGLGESTGRRAVDVAQALDEMKKARGDAAYAARTIGVKTFVNVGGVWIDQAYKADAKVVKVKYLSEAYFAILNRAKDAKRIFALGDRVVWATPSGQVLVVDATGAEKLSDAEIAVLFP